VVLIYSFDILDKRQKYALAINAKGKPFPTESMIMALLLEQHKMINWLQNKIHIPKQRFFKFSFRIQVRDCDGIVTVLCIFESEITKTPLLS
jgi:hypothetical protein